MAEDNNSDSYRWLSLAVVIMGTFMSILDGSIVNIGIPKMMAVFNVSLDDVQWVLTAYTLTLGAIVPITGFLSEKFGNKKLYIFSLISFTIGSLLCGIAWSNTSMIIFRIIQAIGGGMIMPVSMTIILKMFNFKERGLAMGFWGIASMAAPAIGPTLGGYIIEKLSWRLIFNVNVPIGIMTTILSALLLKEFPHKAPEKVDILGFVFSTVGIVSILYILSQNPIDWSDIKNPLLLTIGIFNLILFIINELSVPEPLLDLKLLARLDFSFSLIALALINMCLMGGVYAMPLFFQKIDGYTAMQTGLLLLPSAIVTGVMMPISAKLIDKVNEKIVILPGLILLLFSCYQLGMLTSNTSKDTANLFLILRGAGIGLTMMPLSTFGMNLLPQKLVTQGSTIQNTIRQISGSVSITMMTHSLSSQAEIYYHKLSEQITPFNNTALNLLNQIQQSLSQIGLSTVDKQVQAKSTLVKLVSRQAYSDAFDYALMLCTIFVIVALIATLFIRNRNQLSSSNEEIKS
ncbi:DHA2 family efflux MFS transporter permease subunit [Clostridium sp. 001]|uniref:DHA2 family efflux MFS transporter permease subunit n=1 Tax=Clostridium sp. 001 TaxID=1970093 RepID=UPI001C2C388D|nr:DHA2 family efflux MFS transporter permease subunit [Clostridium sp. 001]QXE20301.1 MFS transporter [Clostridium sp. 001]